MAIIFITGHRVNSDRDYALLKELTLRLAGLGHEIINEDYELGKDIEYSFRRSLNNADVIVSIITESALESKMFYDELLQLRNYSAHSNNKLFIPVYGPKVEMEKLPQSLFSVNGFRLESFSAESINRLVKRIDEAINLFLGRKIATEEKSQVIKEKIEGSAPTYISETISELTKREKYQKNVALFWYILGFLALLSGVVVAVWFADTGLSTLSGNENWSLTIFYALKSIFIIVLLIAASKYSFNLAKSYMSESLKISDRIHAISFGKFYLQVFNQEINPGDIKEIFRDWNINNQQNTFSNQASSDYDPKLLEKLVEIIDKIKGDSGKK